MLKMVVGQVRIETFIVVASAYDNEGTNERPAADSEHHALARVRMGLEPEQVTCA
jgi:hypothetical protein